MNNEEKTGACPVRGSVVPGAAIRQNDYRVTAMLTTVALSCFEHPRRSRARHSNRTRRPQNQNVAEHCMRNLAQENSHRKLAQKLARKVACKQS
jgi:hypothetical protein